jgi:hypothetical protein
MHVGNVTDGPADYNLSGGGQVIEPPEFTGEETFRLEKDKQNRWKISGSKNVSFFVGGNEVASIGNVQQTDLAILTLCGAVYTAFRVRLVDHVEAPPE